MKYLIVALLVLFVVFSSAEDDLLKELDNEVLFDILQQGEFNEEQNDADICTTKSDGEYRDPNDCSKYITCSNGMAIKDRDCPKGLYFNPNTKACDYPYNVDCKSGGKNNCTGKKDGNYPDPNDCRFFIMCSNGMASRMKCPGELKYDPKTDMCDYSEKVVCSVRDEIQYDTERRNQVPKDPFCRNKVNGTYVDPFNCEGFIMCSNHLTYFFDCPSILQYNAKTHRCDWPRNVKCGPKPTKPRPPPTPSPSGFCKNRPNGNYADPGSKNCEGFIMCSNHLTYFFDCPEKLRYNPEKDQCDWPKNVHCGSTPRPTTRPHTTKPRPSPTPSQSGFCKKRPNGNYADKFRIRYKNCGGFITCSNHLTYFFDCPANLRYNPKKDQCDWPWNVRCGPYNPTAPLPPRPKKTPFCKKHGNGNYRDVTNCEGYFTCYNGYQIFRDCPGHLRFNPKTRRCDLPRNVKCGGAGGGTRGSKFCRGRKNDNYRDVYNCNGFIMCSNGYTYFMDCPNILRYNVWTDKCDWPRNVPCHY